MQASVLLSAKDQKMEIFSSKLDLTAGLCLKNKFSLNNMTETGHDETEQCLFPVILLLSGPPPMCVSTLSSSVVLFLLKMKKAKRRLTVDPVDFEREGDNESGQRSAQVTLAS